MSAEQSAGQASEPVVDVVVVGGGVAGLVAARDVVRAGFSAVLVEASDRMGGVVASHTVAGLTLDSGAESFAVRGGSVVALAAELGLGESVVSPDPAGAWVAWPGGAAPLPRRAVLGIPGVPLADDVRAIIGWRGALRAQLDRYRPLLRVRAESNLGDLVRRRMGQRVVDRLVAPVVGGVHSAHPDSVDVATVAPGLTKAMTVQGSLSGAVLSLLEDRGRAGSGRPGSAVAGIDGGVHRLVESLITQCQRYGCDMRTGTRAVALHLRAEPEETDYRSPARVELNDGIVIPARAVILATPLAPSVELLRGAGLEIPPLTEWPGSAPVTLVTLVLDDARLDAAPRGTGILVGEGTPGVAAKALTHATAKWPWLAREAGPGRHVLRLSYGRRDERSADVAASEVAGDLIATALRDASTLLGLPLDRGSLVDAVVVEWRDSLAFATVGHATRVRGVSAALEGIPSLVVAGGWFDGTGLASIVAATRSRVLELNTRLRMS